MRVFEAVPTGGGGQENLLLVTTTPASWEDNNQGVLWGYSVCAAGAPQLRFAVSIGSGASGYTPTLDQANGLISLARLSSSVLIVSVSKAIEIWNVTAKRTPPYRAEP